MARNVSDILRILRLAIARRNENDPDSDDGALLRYINDFASLSMAGDVRLFDQYGTLTLTIDETNTSGVLEYPSSSTSLDFSSLSGDVLISLTDPIGESVSWQPMTWYQDPMAFYEKWGINNEDILVTGFPSDILYYGNQLILRTVPNDSYTLRFFGYRINPDFTTVGDPEIPFDYWLRYIAYGAALDYADDYHFDAVEKGELYKAFGKHRILLLTRTHQQKKNQRCMPTF